MADKPEDRFVVVTVRVTPLGHLEVHAFGADDGEPFINRARAIAGIRRYRRERGRYGMPARMSLHTAKIIKAEAD
jgi:hypothetical protein